MFAFILRRLLQAVAVMLTVALLAFVLFQYVGDPVTIMLGQDATDAERIELRERLGLNDKTVFVLTADHGTEFYEHRRFDHGFTLYDELLRVPLFIRVPGQTAGRDVADRVSSIDVMPTILDLLAVNVPDKAAGQLRGTSLVPALRGKSARRFSRSSSRSISLAREVMRRTSASGSTPACRITVAGSPCVSSKIAAKRSALSTVCRPPRVAWWNASFMTSLLAGDTRGSSVTPLGSRAMPVSTA